MAGTPRCPTCRGSVDRKGGTFPFCSKRCRTVDLGGWLGESYRVADAAPAELEAAALEKLMAADGEDEWPNA